MPFLNDEVKEWIALELESLGVEDLAVYALEAGAEGDERRVMVATEIGLLDHRYAPFGSSARYRLAMLLYPWQVIRGVELRADTFRLWAREHRTRWSFRLHHPHFEAATESADLGQALCDLARVCAVMAEPFGVPAGRASSEVPGAHPGGPRPMPPAGPTPTPVPEPETSPAPPASSRYADASDAYQDDGRDDGGRDVGEAIVETASAETFANGARPQPMSVGEGEEVIELSDEERAAIPTRSDEPR
ncbi:MAG TPA: hypothetical protein VHR55_00865 [Candidatus Limnocylindria bacterium]|nr:hypothetical protein [Candidatus Limnocylindria bacterium]